ncbi:MAG: precorrin-6X reductase [Candidatus Frackibacter sp. T328-2]|nr:MAG: precorrin-6X reductase [Candidatus Frackibacter sp. T328-2]
MIYVLGGTKDSREIVKLLLQEGYSVVASVVTDYGQRLLKEIGDIEIVTDRLDKEGIKELISEYGVDTVIDATHPFAEEVSRNGITATSELEINYIRFERKNIELPENEFIVKKAGFQAAIDYINQTSGRVLLTIGSKELFKFAEGISNFNERVITRVLPTFSVLKECQEHLNIPPANLIAIQGPFSRKLNKQLLLDYEIDLLVTKASGKTGGLDTKLIAAQDLKIPTLVIERPQLSYPKIIDDYKSVIDYIASKEGVG